MARVRKYRWVDVKGWDGLRWVGMGERSDRGHDTHKW